MTPRTASFVLLAMLPAAFTACSGSSPSNLFPSGGSGASVPDAGGTSSEPVQTPAADAAAPAATADAGSGLPDHPTDAGPGVNSIDASSPPSTPPVVDGGSTVATQTVQMTFYGWNDNTPPGNTIAYPADGGYPTVHDGAGGVGTFADPITFASDVHELPAGTLVYAPVLQKYLVMEDDCGPCDTGWTTSKAWQVNVWMNSDGSDSPSALSQCEGAWSQSATAIEINPPAGRAVSTSALFDPTANTCRTTP